MGIRLNKVLTELNIGLQTAIDYLKNKKSLGAIRDDANMNTKISDEQYEALVMEFKNNKEAMGQAGMVFPKKYKKIRCTRQDVDGKECGHMNDYNNTYCVKCGRVLVGKKKVEVIEIDVKNALVQRSRSLVEVKEKLLKQNKAYEHQIQELKREYEKTIRYLTEENRDLMSIIEDEEKEIQQLKEGKGFNSIFVGDIKYDLVLKSAGVAKLQVVKAVKESLNLGLKEAKDLVDEAPSILKRGVLKNEAERLKKVIEAAGATVELR